MVIAERSTIEMEYDNTRNGDAAKSIDAPQMPKGNIFHLYVPTPTIEQATLVQPTMRHKPRLGSRISHTNNFYIQIANAPLFPIMVS